MSLYPEESEFILALQFEQREGLPTAVDLTSALYDFELVYEAAVLQSLADYKDYDFGNFFIVGRNRPLDRSYQLNVVRVSYGSPLTLLASIPWSVIAAGALWPLYKSIELVYTADVRLRLTRKELLVREAQADAELLQARETLARLKARHDAQSMQLINIDIIELPPPTTDL